MPCTVLGAGNREVKTTPLPILITLNGLIWGDGKQVELDGLA